MTRNPHSIKINHITNDNLKSIIKKPTNSTGNDIITIQIIKKLSPSFIPYLSHLINTIINTETYPDIRKISRITPALKPGKRTDSVDSYQPINNLSVIDKIIEQYLKDTISDFFYYHKITLNDHHGSWKGHSTMTALGTINHTMTNNYHNDEITAVIQTDLSATFNTVDHLIMIQKLDFYGVRGKTLNIIDSFLNIDNNMLLSTAESQTFYHPMTVPPYKVVSSAAFFITPIQTRYLTYTN